MLDQIRVTGMETDEVLIEHKFKEATNTENVKEVDKEMGDAMEEYFTMELFQVVYWIKYGNILEDINCDFIKGKY